MAMQSAFFAAAVMKRRAMTIARAE